MRADNQGRLLRALPLGLESDIFGNVNVRACHFGPAQCVPSRERYKRPKTILNADFDTFGDVCRMTLERLAVQNQELLMPISVSRAL